MASQSYNLAFSEKEAQNRVLSPQVVKKYGFDDFKELGLLSESGKIRLLPAQRYFEESENYFPLLLDLFEAWRDESEYMVFKHESEKPLYVAVKCSKRGNDVYASRVERRFSWLKKTIEDQRFFEAKDFTTEKVVKSRLLWVTLTWNTRLFSRRQAWKTEVSECWNRFISAVRRRYGKVSVLRSFEATKQGFPHVHAVLWFEEAEFTVFPHFNEKEGRMSFRISEKAEFESLWHSFVDIEALSSLKKMAHYVLKYQMKVNEGREEEAESRRYGSKTLAFMWLFRKRSYAVSGSFRRLFSDLIRVLHNSNMESEGGSWELLGIFSGRMLGLSGEWFGEIDPERLRGLVSDGDWCVDEGILSSLN